MIWSYSPEREIEFNYSEAIFKDTMVFFYLRKKTFDWNTISNLNGVRIGATSSYNYGKEFNDAEKSGEINVQWVPSDKMNFDKLIAGRIDVFPWELSSGHAFLKKHIKEQQALLVTHHPRSLKEDTYHLLLSKNIKLKKDYMKIFNRGLMRMQKMGKIEQYLSNSKKGQYKK